MKVFGSKWGATKRGVYPEPRCSTIYEPFGGACGFSCGHSELDVVLRETHPELAELWRWLIEEATEATIRDIPILVPGTDILEVGLTRGQALLTKWWQRTNNHGTKTWVTSPWCNKPGQWTPSTRSRIAEQVEAIRHWKVNADFEAKSATVFVDPPYIYNYQYGWKLGATYYALLAEAVREAERCNCQVIACEAIGKGGEVPTYLPFRRSHSQVTSRRKVTNNHHSKELIYVTQTV